MGGKVSTQLKVTHVIKSLVIMSMRSNLRLAYAVFDQGFMVAVFVLFFP